jgi:CheY-like chemotaxis protein
MSKIETGHISIEIAELDLDETMQHLFDFFKPQASEKGVILKLKTIPLGKKLYIRTDAFKLEAILINYLKNAIKFTREGVIEFGAYPEEEVIVFYVKDTGIGIPANRLHAVFDRFVKADLNQTRPHEGSGLGLSIVRAYGKMLGGRTWVESTEGKGSVFYFSMPLKEVENQTKPLDGEGMSPVPLRPGLTLLVVEDDDISYQYLETVLQRTNIRLIRAVNGPETIEIYKNNPGISLILMDIKIPGMNGFEVTRLIRSLNPDIPIIALTAYAFSVDRKLSIEAGCNEYLSKPVHRKELLEMISRYTSDKI